jgi:hypothetical protein
MPILRTVDANGDDDYKTFANSAMARIRDLEVSYVRFETSASRPTTLRERENPIEALIHKGPLSRGIEKLASLYTGLDTSEWTK